jgi:hypothetical protein
MKTEPKTAAEVWRMVNEYGQEMCSIGEPPSPDLSIRQVQALRDPLEHVLIPILAEYEAPRIWELVDEYGRASFNRDVDGGERAWIRLGEALGPILVEWERRLNRALYVARMEDTGLRGQMNALDVSDDRYV